MLIEDINFKKSHVSKYDLNFDYDSNVFVSVVQFSSFHESANLIAFETSTVNGRISINSIEMNEEHFKIKQLITLIIGSKINRIAWSPESNSKALPMLIKLAVSCFYNNQIQIIKLNLNEIKSGGTQPSVEDMNILVCDSEHSDFINDIAFEPLTGELLASVSDDCTCCLWSAIDGSLKAKWRLTSAGMSVKWHPIEPTKLMIAEKKGIIRFYNLESIKPVMSFDGDKYPLLSADWCLSNNLLIGCVSDSEVLIWDTSISSKPNSSIKGHVQGGHKFIFFNENVFATRGAPENQIKVYNSHTQRELLCESSKSGGDISWSKQYPLLAVSSNNKIIFYKFNSFI